MADFFQNDQSNLADCLNAHLQPFKLIIPSVHSFFTWGKQYYPILLASYITFIYILIWCFEASILTTLSIFGIVVCVGDYTLPIVIDNFVDSSKWTEKDESKYNEICNNLSTYWHQVLVSWNSWKEMKSTKPKSYLFSLLAVLLMLAWIGNTINNLFLAYLITLATALFPGLKHHGILKKGLDSGITLIKSAIGGKDKKN